MGGTAAAESAPTDCRADQLKKAKVTALAEFKHRGNTFSMVTSTMDIDVPAPWAHASDLLLDAHAPAYRFALACLVGKPIGDGNDFRDGEYRFKPVTVKADGQWVKVHYEAATWVQTWALDAVGPWTLEASKDSWNIALRPPPALENADWDSVQVDLGGRGALTATPRPAFGEGGAKLSWRHKEPDQNPTVTFRPPTLQHWDFITTSLEETWQVWETCVRLHLPPHSGPIPVSSGLDRGSGGLRCPDGSVLDRSDRRGTADPADQRDADPATRDGRRRHCGSDRDRSVGLSRL